MKRNTWVVAGVAGVVLGGAVLLLQDDSEHGGRPGEADCHGARRGRRREFVADDHA
ncbi:hypothetical protein [Streptomyces sp. NPDC048295]|uniref:hypothetical protein n=1 Tax=Streptomyces sp. NPDC048295 TaxID=3154617 RepID=UPI00341F99D0